MNALMLKIAQKESVWSEARRAAGDELHGTYTSQKGRTLRSIGGAAKGGAMWGAGMSAAHGYLDGKDKGLKGKELLKHVARKGVVGGVSGAVGGAAGGVGNAIIGHTVGRGVHKMRSRTLE